MASGAPSFGMESYAKSDIEANLTKNIPIDKNNMKESEVENNKISKMTADTVALGAVGDILNDRTRPLKERFRALFTLRNIGGKEAIDHITRCFSDSSSLLKHELGFCLGQMQDEYAIPTLTTILKNRDEEKIVRHEAAEALGAIGSKEVLNLLEEYTRDPVIEVAETCQLAVSRIRWAHSARRNDEDIGLSPYMSIDPAPAHTETDTRKLWKILLNEDLPLFERYRAMFSLRNKGDDRESVTALGEGLKCSSALFRHEIAYVLGQIQSPTAVPYLSANLRNLQETPMVRHECAEALGAIATNECMALLTDFLTDHERVVRESCEVALDMGEYEQSEQFQYATTLAEAMQAAQ